MQLFDGHGGAEAANYARDHLASLLLEDHNFHAHPGEALVNYSSDFLQIRII